jgi:hypothetical protein
MIRGRKSQALSQSDSSARVASYSDSLALIQAEIDHSSKFEGQQENHRRQIVFC